MTDLVRQVIGAEATTIVVKVGTRVLTSATGALDDARIEAIAGEVAQIASTGRKVVIVSSGAVGAGIGRLNLTARPTSVARLQAVAAVGQSRLTEAYDRALRPHGLHAAQVLLTVDDLDDRARYLNVRNTLLALFEYGAVPIVNENDTTATDELQISFGDNDRLAAHVTNLLRASLLILLSDVDGLYDGPPDNPASQRVDTVTDLAAAKAFANASRGGGAGAVQLSKGGMASKLEAARIATSAGENVIIAAGRSPNILTRILAGETVGTLIMAHGPTVTSRKRWLTGAARTRGEVWIDAGATRAVETEGRSLLAVGVVEVRDAFQKGDVISIRDATGREFARGLTNYASDDLRRIAGRAKGQIESVLGHCPYDEVIHRDNLAMM